MTTMTAPVQFGRPGPRLPRLVRSELLKVRTTSVWWWLAIGAFLTTAAALALNAWSAYMMLSGRMSTEGLSTEQARQIAAQNDVVLQAAGIYTSGQFFGLMFVMLIGILMVTNEFFHQTATTTFLSTPRRTSVIVSKLLAATLVGLAFWLVTTLIDLAAGTIYLNVAGYGAPLGAWGVWRAILLNLLAYAIWTIFGVGFGTLITNQLGSVITATSLYLIGTQAAALIFFLLATWFDNMSILKWQVIVPSIASQVMISGGNDIPGTPEWWVGLLILIGYAVATGTIGVLITRRRDIS